MNLLVPVVQERAPPRAEWQDRGRGSQQKAGYSRLKRALQQLTFNFELTLFPSQPGARLGAALIWGFCCFLAFAVLPRFAAPYKPLLFGIPNVSKVLSPKTGPFKENIAIVDLPPKLYEQLFAFNLLVEHFVDVFAFPGQRNSQFNFSRDKIAGKRNLSGPLFWMRSLLSRADLGSYTTVVDDRGSCSGGSNSVFQFKRRIPCI